MTLSVASTKSSGDIITFKEDLFPAENNESGSSVAPADSTSPTSFHQVYMMNY